MGTQEVNGLLFQCITGSQAYGTAIPTSDIDRKAIYIQPQETILGFGYRQQIDISKDHTVYEIRRFMELLSSANPTILEMLYAPADTIEFMHPVLESLFANRESFLTKKCRNSFGGYAVEQIQKARGLDKKMNWEKGRVTRKTPTDFVYAYMAGKTMPISKYLESKSMLPEFCGLVALDHFKDCYALYYDYVAQYGAAANRPYPSLGYRGLGVEDSNHLRLSSVPKYVEPETVVFYNKDGYSTHCKEFKQYEEWLEKRNTARYVDNVGHGQKIDSKNMCHCRRLLDVALEIPTTKSVNVRRPNADYLLQIRRGEVNLDEIINQAEADISSLENLYAKSDLPETVDPEFVNYLLISIREEVYGML